jgi:basic amino acid/polyamine antiporter, APA family
VTTLDRTLSFPQLTFYGVGSMVGAGIYSVIGAAAGEAGVHLWLSFVLAGAAAILTVLSYAELASALPKAGAEYQFLKAAFPKWRTPAFLAGYLIAVNAAATAATVAVAFAGYLSVFVSAPAMLTAFALLAACTAVNVAGIRESTWVGIGLICIEVAGLLLIIWVGFVHGAPAHSFTEAPGAGHASGIFAATALIFFMYVGFEDVANLAEEARDPKRNIPRALLVSIGVTSVIYVLVSLAAIALISPEALAGSDHPLSTAVATVRPWLGQVLAVCALFATASTALIVLVSISRLLYGMARDGDMPQIFAGVLTNRRTPWIAALALFGAACLLLPLGEVRIIASVSSLGLLIVFVGVQGSVIVLRYRRPDMERSFRVPLSVGRFPVLSAIGMVITGALLTQFEPVVYAVGAAALAGGAGLYVWNRTNDTRAAKLDC